MTPDAPSNSSPPNRAPRSALARWVGRALRALLLLAVLAGGIGLAYYWLSRPPTARRRRPPTLARLVRIQPVRTHDEQVLVRAMGRVVPARSVRLAARVAGPVVEIDPRFDPGGEFSAGQTLLHIEDRDYQLAVQQRQAELTRTRAEARIESGRQDIALREYELLGQEVTEDDRELLLREPQLAMAEAAVAAAQAALDKARLDLARTEVTAPFNAIVQRRAVEIGSQVNVGTELATLVGSDTYWVEVSVPVDELDWLNIPGHNSDTASPVRVLHPAAWGEDPNAFRRGRLLRLLPELEPQGRMARLLVAVTDPLHRTAPAGRRRPLLLDSYVRVAIEGRMLRDVVTVPRTALREGREVWVMTDEDTLAIRPVTLAWTGEDRVLVSAGLADGERLVVSELQAPVEGMALRLPEANTQPSDAPRDAQHAAGREGRP